MDDIIQTLRELPLEFNGGVSPTELSRFQRAIGCDLPEELAALYRDHDGMPRQPCRAMRLLPVDEVIEFHQNTREMDLPDWGVKFFWTDDNSNYASVYVEGPLRGKVCFLDHDDVELSPRFRSITSFLNALVLALEGGLDWTEMNRDYPERRSGHSPALEDDWQLVQSLQMPLKIARDDDRQHWQLCIVTMTPPKQTETLLPYLDSRDQWVAARCCEVLGLRKFSPAIPKLFEVARRHELNSGIAALMALAHFGTPECLQLIVQLIDLLPKGNSPYLAKALEECGCDVGHSDCKWHYRLPGSEVWIPMP